jgi:NAD(P)-dependent dehydrogenase (short-subunit alcohol dehydrogenase family)
MAGEMAGRVAFVTGAGRGIGREIAIGLAGAGARVALVARTADQLYEVASTVRAAGGEAAPITADIGDPEQASAAVETARSRLGAIEILINNAAMVAPLGPTSTLEVSEIESALALNVGSVVILSGLVIPGMQAAGWGRIVNVSSGIVANPSGMIGATVYAATKAALEAHTLNLSAELADTGITVNAYRPGAVDTAMQGWIRDQSPDVIGEALHGRFVASHASGQLLTPAQSAARLLEHLASEDTGQIWDVREKAV